MAIIVSSFGEKHKINFEIEDNSSCPQPPNPPTPRKE